MAKRCSAKNCFNSVATTKSVDYYGFPKNEEFSKQWAIAAGREDLLKKPLKNIVKYFLCSEHFAANCFLNVGQSGVHRILKRNLPYSIAMPTIFKNNLHETLQVLNPKLKTEIHNIILLDKKGCKIEKKSSNVIELDPGLIPPDRIKVETNINGKNSNAPEQIQARVLNPKLKTEIHNIIMFDKKSCKIEKKNSKVIEVDPRLIPPDQIKIETNINGNNSNAPDDFQAKMRAVPQRNARSLLRNDIKRKQKRKSERNSSSNLKWPAPATIYCRLCSNPPCQNEEFHLISELPSVGTFIQRILPDKICENDGRSQNVCQSCVEKVTFCMSVIQQIDNVQEQLESSGTA